MDRLNRLNARVRRRNSERSTEITGIDTDIDTTRNPKPPRRAGRGQTVDVCASSCRFGTTYVFQSAVERFVRPTRRAQSHAHDIKLFTTYCGTSFADTRWSSMGRRGKKMTALHENPRGSGGVHLASFTGSVRAWTRRETRRKMPSCSKLVYRDGF